MNIKETIVLAKKQKGRYKAFPTAVRLNDGVVVAYRDGVVDPTKPHGSSGMVRLLRSRDFKEFVVFDTPFRDNELDAIISGPFDERLVLFSRSYEHGLRNESYVSSFSVDELPQNRRRVQIEGVDIAAFFGHPIPFKDGFVATAYGAYNKKPSPLLLYTEDWLEFSFLSAITPDGFEPNLNETSIVKTDRGFLAIMRSREPSYELYYSLSDDLIVWSEPKRLEILGHAPMVRRLKNSMFCMVFRHLEADSWGVGLAKSKDGIDWDVFRIHSYSGDLYNGGYGDFVEIDGDNLFVVYYTSDRDNEPWIEAKIVEL
ncbi:sialidase family protein [Hippea sp. KM1]|uniref:sialidase family protein n=1 Tax=Hippea sp. KM1 TaxID=944481 RepID=UPI00046CB881|nr:sialidase family protein [Hippea sp. KM1]